jgi:hypothetical protein
MAEKKGIHNVLGGGMDLRACENCQQLASKDGLLLREKASASATKQKLEQELKEKDKQISRIQAQGLQDAMKIKELEAYYLTPAEMTVINNSILKAKEAVEAMKRENAALRIEASAHNAELKPLRLECIQLGRENVVFKRKLKEIGRQRGSISYENEIAALRKELEAERSKRGGE